MKTIIFTIICIIALLWVGDLTITFKPFSISLPGWYKPVGILLFFLSMAVYTIGEYTKGYKHGFDDGIKNVLKYLKRKIHEQTIQSNHFRGIIPNRVVPFFFTLV